MWFYKRFYSCLKMSCRKVELEEIDKEKKQAIDKNSIRSQKFSLKLSKTIEKFVNSLGLPLFQRTYWEIHKHFPTDIKILHNQLQTQLSCHITSTVRKKCHSHQVILFIEHPEVIERSLIKTSICQRRRKQVTREAPKVVKDSKILEKIHFRDNLLKKLKKMEAIGKEQESTMFKNHEYIVQLGVKIKQSRDLLLKTVDIMGSYALSNQMDRKQTLLELCKERRSK